MGSPRSCTGWSPSSRRSASRRRWEVIKGDAKFYDITKKIHNALQGNAENPTSEMWEYYEEVNRKNAAMLDLEADAVLIHDPQPAPLIRVQEIGGLDLALSYRCFKPAAGRMEHA